MAKVVVTGGAGFIGCNLARELVERGYEVVVLDNLSTGKIENIHDLKDIQVINGDIRNLELIHNTFKGATYIFHQAALGSVPRSIDDPITSNDNNVTGTLNVLVAARDAGVQKLVYAGSSSAYGNSMAEYKTEDLPANPLSPYALTKYTGEVYCRLFTEIYGLPTVTLRYFNVFGPYQRPDSQYAAVIPKFITAMLKGERPQVNGDGNQGRDFTYVRNNVEANILAAESEVSGETINIACGEMVTLNELIAYINEELGTAIEPEYHEPRPGDVRTSKAGVAKAKELLGYVPTYYFRDGLKETIQWYKNQ